MRFRDLALLAGGVSAGMWIYGTLVEAHRLVLERRTLRLRDWPDHLAGYRIAVLSDLHLGHPASVRRGHRAVAMALQSKPDIVVLPGDIIERWSPASAQIVHEVLRPLLAMNGNVLAIPGNHDYDHAPDLHWMPSAMSDLNIRLLRNESVRMDGITWVGLDSVVEQRARLEIAFAQPPEAPSIVLWHEADMVGMLPLGNALQISGHSHGGQFRFPGGYTPMYSYLGKKYPRGFYPDAPTPLYVSRGVGTTGFPTRFNCAPEVSLLTLQPL